MSDDKTCPKCKARMELGRPYGVRLAGRWVEGRQQAPWSWLPGVSTLGKRVLRIDVYRCTGCGFLESYAP